ncbi:MAG: hypothetical protein ACD_78C00462G0002 [uncultured bacterium (gcode 4)]|uniref:Uncharacterized protein n=1 Tax=uncultured bacterium (gcode 4) TaxID=1234023 RepID=K1XWE8_9BACT|nr:MAG: hypothetical protein ACD_78C00462G0002 [uncultured bacterium (gcode 4)]
MGEKDPDDGGVIFVEGANRVIMHCLGHSEAMFPLPGEWVAVIANTIHAAQAKAENILQCGKRRVGWVCCIGTSFRKPCSPDLVMQPILTCTSAVDYILDQSDNTYNILPSESSERVQHLSCQ